MHLVDDLLVPADVEHEVARHRGGKRRVEGAAEEEGIPGRGIEGDDFDVPPARRGDEDGDGGAAAGHAEVAVLHRERERLARTDERAVRQRAHEHLRLVDLVVRRELPPAVQQTRLGVREVDAEHHLDLLARLLVVAALEGHAGEHVVRLRLDGRFGDGEPLVDRLLRAGQVAHRDHQVDVAEHRLAAGLGALVDGVVADGLVFEMGGVEAALVAGDLRAGEHEARGQIRGKLLLLREHGVDKRLGLEQQRVLVAAAVPELLDGPGDELRRIAQGVLLEDGEVRAQQRPRAFGVAVLQQLVGCDVERIGGVALVDGVDAGHVRGDLGHPPGQRRVEVGIAGARDAGEDVGGLPLLRLDGRLDQLADVPAAAAVVAQDHRAAEPREGFHVAALKRAAGRADGQSVDRPGILEALAAVGEGGHDLLVDVGEDGGEFPGLDLLGETALEGVEVAHAAVGDLRGLHAGQRLHRRQIRVGGDVEVAERRAQILVADRSREHRRVAAPVAPLQQRADGGVLLHRRQLRGAREIALRRHVELADRPQRSHERVARAAGALEGVEVDGHEPLERKRGGVGDGVRLRALRPDRAHQAVLEIVGDLVRIDDVEHVGQFAERDGRLPVRQAAQDVVGRGLVPHLRVVRAQQRLLGALGLRVAGELRGVAAFDGDARLGVLVEGRRIARVPGDLAGAVPRGVLAELRQHDRHPERAGLAVMSDQFPVVVEEGAEGVVHHRIRRVRVRPLEAGHGALGHVVHPVGGLVARQAAQRGDLAESGEERVGAPGLRLERGEERQHRRIVVVREVLVFRDALPRAGPAGLAEAVLEQRHAIGQRDPGEAEELREPVGVEAVRILEEVVAERVLDEAGVADADHRIEEDGLELGRGAELGDHLAHARDVHLRRQIRAVHLIHGVVVHEERKLVGERLLVGVAPLRLRPDVADVGQQIQVARAGPGDVAHELHRLRGRDGRRVAFEEVLRIARDDIQEHPGVTGVRRLLEDGLQLGDALRVRRPVGLHVGVHPERPGQQVLRQHRGRHRLLDLQHVVAAARGPAPAVLGPPPLVEQIQIAHLVLHEHVRHRLTRKPRDVRPARGHHLRDDALVVGLRRPLAQHEVEQLQILVRLGVAPQRREMADPERQRIAVRAELLRVADQIFGLGAFKAERDERAAHLRRRPRLELGVVGHAIALDARLPQQARDLGGFEDEVRRRLLTGVENRQRAALRREQPPVRHRRIEGHEQRLGRDRHLLQQRLERRVHFAVATGRRQLLRILKRTALREADHHRQTGNARPFNRRLEFHKSLGPVVENRLREIELFMVAKSMPRNAATSSRSESHHDAARSGSRCGKTKIHIKPQF